MSSRVTLVKEVLGVPTAASSSGEGIGLWWMGQAGFLIESKETRLLVDPYLSDSLERQFGLLPLSHRRMSPAPVRAEELRDIDVILVTHDHGDHLDPDTLLPITRANPDCRLVLPGSAMESALGAGLPRSQLLPIEVFQGIDVGALRVSAIPSAHEELAIDQHGRSLFLGYVFELDGIRFYHSGDCAPYAGLLDNLAPYKIDVGLLPVNGRDAKRRSQGILGNFNLAEALALAEGAGFGFCLGHHFGLFDFNTIDEGKARELLRRDGKGRFELVSPEVAYKIGKNL
ncbi:MAG TPA: MBL fold metallo-hydrolase [Rectinemataceae bacterium]|nr:MBL fold metallo-hydrolase [Rectinemataceae bacterium]